MGDEAMRRDLFLAGIIMVFVGIALIVLAPFVSLISSSATSTGIKGGKVVGGGCIVVAFIPICFGFGMGWLQLIILAAVVLAIAIVMYILIRSMVRGVGFEPTQAYASGSLTPSRRS